MTLKVKVVLWQEGKCPPQNVRALIPGPVVVMLHGKRDFAAVIMDLKIGRLSWIIREAQSNHRSP